jgi:hypothetical protein
MLSVEGCSPAVSGLYARTNVRYVTCNPSPVLLAFNESHGVHNRLQNMHTARNRIRSVGRCKKRGSAHVVILLSGGIETSPSLRVYECAEVNQSATELAELLSAEAMEPCVFKFPLL